MARLVHPSCSSSWRILGMEALEKNFYQEADMNETTEIWAEWKKEKQTARAQRRESAPDVLRAKGIFFISHNNGAHLAVETPMGVVDFWPGTTRWATRQPTGLKGFGLETLLEYINPEFTK